MNASIYTIKDGQEVAYQYGNSRAIKAKTDNPTTGWYCEILKAGQWVKRSNDWLTITARTKRALSQ